MSAVVNILYQTWCGECCIIGVGMTRVCPESKDSLTRRVRASQVTACLATLTSNLIESTSRNWPSNVLFALIGTLVGIIPDICHLSHLYICGEKICHVEKFQSSMHGRCVEFHTWSNFKFLHMTDV